MLESPALELAKALGGGRDFPMLKDRPGVTFTGRFWCQTTQLELPFELVFSFFGEIHRIVGTFSSATEADLNLSQMGPNFKLSIPSS